VAARRLEYGGRRNRCRFEKRNIAFRTRTIGWMLGRDSNGVLRQWTRHRYACYDCLRYQLDLGGVVGMTYVGDR
jgi:hypothetical protein